MKVLLISLLFLVSYDLTVTARSESPPQECDPLVFRGVSTDAWTCIREKLTAEGFTVGAGYTGQISHNQISSGYVLNKGARTLTITITRQKYGCKSIIKALTELIDACRDFEEVRLIRRERGEEEWKIEAPNVKQAETAYMQIRFRRNDTVFVKAGGCVQHGGPGKTWGLYVDPKKPRTSPYFFGRIRLPGMPAMKNLAAFIAEGGEYRVPDIVAGEVFLTLGFSDFRHTDNGYWGREGDDGYEDQCKDKENAWVEVKIVRGR